MTGAGSAEGNRKRGWVRRRPPLLWRTGMTQLAGARNTKPQPRYPTPEQAKRQPDAPSLATTHRSKLGETMDL